MIAPMDTGSGYLPYTPLGYTMKSERVGHRYAAHRGAPVVSGARPIDRGHAIS